MAASTIAPMAMAMPPSDMMFDVSPMAFIGMKLMMTATGMVIIGITALGTCQRNTRITSETTISSSMSVCFRLSIERRISSLRS